MEFSCHVANLIFIQSCECKHTDLLHNMAPITGGTYITISIRIMLQSKCSNVSNYEQLISHQSTKGQSQSVFLKTNIIPRALNAW